jgi:hypothetical protein
VFDLLTENFIPDSMALIIHMGVPCENLRLSEDTNISDLAV